MIVPIPTVPPTRTHSTNASVSVLMRKNMATHSQHEATLVDSPPIEAIA